MTRQAMVWRIVAAGGLSAALAMAQFFVPIAGALLSLFAPLPLLWLLVRDAGGRPAGAAALLAAGLPAAVADHNLALGLVAQFGPLTAVLGLGLRRGWSLTASVGGAAAAAVAVGLAALLVRSGLDPVAASEAIAAQVEAAVSVALARTAGDAVDHRPLAALFVRLMPGLTLVGTIAAAWVNLFVLRWRAGRTPDGKRAGEDGQVGAAEQAEGPQAGARPAAEVRGRPPLDDWSRWSAPEPLVFLLILGGAALGRWYPDLIDGWLLCVTEQRTRAEIDRLADALEGLR